MDTRHLVFIEDIAAYFQVCTKTVRRWVRHKKMPHVRGKGVQALRFDKAKVLQWAEQNNPKES